MTTRRYQQEINRFEVEYEDGRRATLVEYQQIIESTPVSGSTSISKGAKEMSLTNGHGVNYINDDTFEDVNEDEIIKRVK